MSLIGWWKLDGDATDSLGNYDGTATSVSWVDGKINQAGDFTASGRIIDIPNITSPTLTLCAWHKWDATSTTWRTVFGGDSNKHHMIFNNNRSINIFDGVTRSFGYSSPDNEWHHYVVIIESGSMGYLYVDGTYQGETITTLDLATYPVNTLGNWYNNSYPAGFLDDLRIYDHALSPKEIKQLSQAKVAHWKFDDFQEPTTNKSNIDISAWTTKNGLTVTETTAVSPPIPGAKVYLATKTLDSSLLRDGGTSSGPLSPDSAVDHAFSVYVRTTSNTTSTSFSVDIGDGASASVTPDSNWQRVVAIGTGNATDGTRDFTDINVGGLTGNEFYLSCVQVEKKDHVTPWSESSRIGKVRDSSGYGYDITMTEATSPAWVEDSNIGQGAYSFDGVDQILQVDDELHLLESISVFAWANPDVSVSSYNVVGKRPSNQGWIIHNAATNQLRCYVHVGGSWYSATTSGVYSPGTWSHVGFTYDGETLQMYADGEPVGSNASMSGPITKLDGIVEIGGTTYSSSQMWDGRVDDVRIYAAAITDAEVKEIYQQRASLDSKGNLQSHDLVETEHQSMLVDYTTWEVGTGSATGFSRNGTDSENHRILASDPWNKETVIWEARPEAASGSDGGWNGSYFAIDTDKMYRFSVWVNRTISGNGNFYLGTNGGTAVVLNLSNGASNSNPYFWAGTDLPQGEWILVVGHVWPAGTAFGGSKHPDSGRWRMDGTLYGGISHDFIMQASTTSLRHRSYLYYSTDTKTRQRWAYPRVDVIDGTEPSLSDLLHGLDSRNVEYTRDIGGTTAQSFSVGKKFTRISELNEIGSTNGMIGRWTFNGDAIDSAGNGYHGNATDVTWTGGVVSGAGSFNGSTSVIKVPYVSPFDLQTLSITAWVNFADNSNSFIFEKGNVNTQYSMFSHGDDIVFRTKPVGASYDTLSATKASAGITNGQWHFIVATYDGATKRVYVDGNEILTRNWANEIETHAGDCSIGRFGGTTTGYYFTGEIDEVRVYNRALTTEEIGILYDITSPGTMMKQTPNALYVSGNFNEVSL